MQWHIYSQGRRREVFNLIFARRRGGGVVGASFFNCMAASVRVANLGALAANYLSCFALIGEVVFVSVASKAGDKFSELLLLA